MILSGQTSGDSRQRTVSNALIGGLTGIVGTKIERLSEFASGDSRQ
jgi:hypothetical protein